MTDGHGRAINLLSKLAANNNIPHALLFTGLDRNEKRAAAFEFAQKLFKKDSIDSSLEFNPDFLMIEGSPIQIKQIRDLKARFSLSAAAASYKIAIIDDVESMPPVAANSFLKLLEEPMGNCVFILIARSRLNIMPTVASRTVEIRFGNVNYMNSSTHFAEDIKIFESGLLYKKFHEAKKYSLENKLDLVELLDAWTLKLRGELLSNKVGVVGMIKKIVAAKKIILTTNTNPQLVMEELLCAMH